MSTCLEQLARTHSSASRYLRHVLPHQDLYGRRNNKYPPAVLLDRVPSGPTHERRARRLVGLIARHGNLGRVDEEDVSGRADCQTVPTRRSNDLGGSRPGVAKTMDDPSPGEGQRYQMRFRPLRWQSQSRRRLRAEAMTSRDQRVGTCYVPPSRDNVAKASGRIRSARGRPPR